MCSRYAKDIDSISSDALLYYAILPVQQDDAQPTPAPHPVQTKMCVLDNENCAHHLLPCQQHRRRRPCCLCVSAAVKTYMYFMLVFAIAKIIST